jgi:PKD repeat protein
LYTYRVPGIYTVSLTAVNADGSDTKTMTDLITVLEPPKPVSSFSAVPMTGNFPLNVQFTDESVEGNFPITSYHWDFGDNTNSTLQNPNHTYTKLGNYLVNETISDSESVTSSNTTIIVVLAAEVPLSPSSHQVSRTGRPRCKSNLPTIPFLGIT